MAGRSYQLMTLLLQLACVLGAAAFLVSIADAANRSRECPPCGGLPVPYPLSTSPWCGHPLYRITCTVRRQLQVNALSGRYIVQSVDPATRSMVISTAPFVGESCVTTDSIASHNFSLVPGAPLKLAPDNTILLLNASEMLRWSPLKCGPEGPCGPALPWVPQQSCRNLYCCAFDSEARVFTYGFPNYGQETGYASVLNMPPPGPVPRGWRPNFGLRLVWDMPMEPPCETQTDCGDNSKCVKSVLPVQNSVALESPNLSSNVCACNHGYRWDGSDGVCREVPYCVRHPAGIRCHKLEYAIGIVFGTLGLAALVALVLTILNRRRRVKMAHAKLVKERSLMLVNKNGGPSARLFSSKEMKRATNNFASDRVLGCGGFGEVYKGVLDDKTVVAIKSAKIGNVKGVEQVLNEVRVLSQVAHGNLVRLLGCCVETPLPLMVYEYVPNGNLYQHLEDNSSLDWKIRLQIAVQSAEGLAYLHSACPPIYHRDVKSSNILLDKSMNARVADFGLSQLAKPDVYHVSTCAQGTVGYLDPEYYRTYHFTDKSDVYSFGIVLLELLTSQKAVDFTRGKENVNLAVMAQARKEGQLHEVFDPRLTKGASKEVISSMTSVMEIARKCLNESGMDRPTMKEIVAALQHIKSVLEEGCYEKKSNGNSG